MTAEVEKNTKVSKYLPLLYEGLNEDTLLKAEKELKETEDKIRKGLRDLRDFIKKSNLPIELGDEMLLAFLRVGKYNFKKCREKLAKYCSLRRKREYIHMADVDKVLFVLDNNITGILPYRDAEGTTMIFFRLSAWRPEICDWDDVVGSVFALVHFALSFPVTTVSGVTLISDLHTDNSGLLFHVFSFGTQHIYDMLTAPMRVKRIIGFNTNWLCRFCVKCLLPFLPVKLSKRLHVHSGGIVVPGDLCPPYILPNEFGGTMGPLNNDHFRDQFERFLKKLQAEDSIY